ncbi:MAG: hypothetical protein ACRDDA_14365 [Aeromonas sp.]
MWTTRSNWGATGNLIILLTIITLTGNVYPQKKNGVQKKQKKDATPNKQFDLNTLFEEKYRNTYDINLWYRYAKFLAHSVNQTDCYVCSKMPVSSANPHVIPTPVQNPSDLFPECLVSAYSPKVLNATMNHLLPAPVDMSVITFKNFLGLERSTNTKLYGPVHVSPRTNFTCYENWTPFFSKTAEVGKIPDHNCGIIYSPCTKNATGHFNESEATGKAKCATYFTVPDAMGTTPQTNFVWLCGLNVYTNLPTGWQGRCAPMIPADHSYIITAKNYHRMKRQENFKPHDSVWGTDVPLDHKLWNDGQKVALALFPWVGVGKLMLRVETVAYRFESFVNTTITALKGIKEELTALRLMEMQDRMVLDQMTASLGGVCAMVGTTCCTFIPENDEDGHVIDQAITNLTALRDATEKDLVTTSGLLQWLFGGQWWHVFLKVFVPIIAVLILFCLCMTCVIPCIAEMIKKMVNSMLTRVYMITLEKNQTDDELYENLVMEDREIDGDDKHTVV